MFSLNFQKTSINVSLNYADITLEFKRGSFFNGLIMGIGGFAVYTDNDNLCISTSSDSSYIIIPSEFMKIINNH